MSSTTRTVLLVGVDSYYLRVCLVCSLRPLYLARSFVAALPQKQRGEEKEGVGCIQYRQQLQLHVTLKMGVLYSTQYCLPTHGLTLGNDVTF